MNRPERMLKEVSILQHFSSALELPELLRSMASTYNGLHLFRLVRSSDFWQVKMFLLFDEKKLILRLPIGDKSSFQLSLIAGDDG